MNKTITNLIKKNRRGGGLKLPLTSMVDMFTIMIVYLLMSFSSSAVHLTPHKDLTLPFSMSDANPIEALKIVVALDGIYVENEMVLPLKDGKFEVSALDDRDPDFVPKVFEELDRHAEKSKAISEKNESMTFDGKVVMQADARLEYEVLKKVLYTASMAGYADLKLATLGGM